MKHFHEKFILDGKKNRILHILHMLERTHLLSTSYLAKTVGATTRTIISDIATIREMMIDTVRIESTNLGYSFEILDMNDYKEKKQSISQDEPLYSIVNNIFWGEFLNPSLLADELNLSESIILRHMASLEHVIAEYQLTLSTDPFCFEGDECCIRKFFLDFFYETEVTITTLLPTSKIKNIAYTLTKEGNLNIPFNKLCYILIIVLERIQTKHFVKVNSDIIEKVLSDISFVQFKKNGELFEKEFGTELSTDELIHLYILITADRSIFEIAEEINWVYTYRHKTVDRISEVYCDKFSIKPKDKVRIFIQSHLLSNYLLYRLHPIYVLNTPDIIAYTNSRYPIDFEKTLAVLNSFYCFSNINNDEIKQSLVSNLTLFKNALEDHYYLYPPKKVAFLLDGHRNICLKFQTTFMRYFSSECEATFLTPCDLADGHLEHENIDLLITNYQNYKEEFQINCECLLINLFSDSDDWNNVLVKINPRIVKYFSLKNSSL